MLSSGSFIPRVLLPALTASCLIFVVFLTTVVNTSPVLSQTVPKPADRRKNFGKSLKKFEEKRKDLPAPTAAGGGETVDVLTIDTDLVVIDALVVNEKGKAILGLNSGDFIVTDNGAEQEVELFERGDRSPIPKMIVLIIEVGGSPSLADQSLEAAKVLVDKLAAIDRMAIADTNLKLRVDFTDDKRLLKSTLESLKRESKAGRHEYSTLMAALNELFSADDKRQIVIQQTYGGEIAFLKPAWKLPFNLCRRTSDYCERKFSLADVRDVVARSRATIYTVYPGPQVIALPGDQQIARSNSYFERFLKEAPIPPLSKQEKAAQVAKYQEINLKEHSATQTAIAELTGLAGGYTSFLETPEDAVPIYEGIFRTIENRYTIGFYPKDKRRDGQMRQVKIRVRNHPEYMVIGRGAYYPQ